MRPAIGERIGTRPWHQQAAWVIVGVFCAWCVYLTASAILQDRKKDFYEFFAAAEAMTRGQDPYDVGGTGYIYPPILATLLVPMVPLGLVAATILWGVISAGVMVFCAWIGSREVIKRFGVEPRRALVAVAMCVAVVVAADKMRNEIVMGQSNLLMVLAWTLGLVWLDRRPVPAGIALGFGANIKYLTLVAVPYLIVRGRFKAAIATVTATVGWALLPAVYLGWSTDLKYVRKAFGGIIGMVEAKDGAEVLAKAQEAARVPLMREGFSMSITSWASRMLSPTGINVQMLALLAAVGALTLAAVWLIYRRWRVPLFAGRWGAAERAMGAVVALEWTGLVVASLAFGPQTNSRHLTMLLLPIATGVAVCLGSPPLRGGSESRRGAAGYPRVWPLVVGIGVLWAGITLPFGGESMRDVIDTWRQYAGPSWCMLVMLGALLWVGLEARPPESIKSTAA